MDKPLYIEVILPFPVADSFTYKVPAAFGKQISPGSLVEVEFGKRNRYTGVVYYIHHIPPKVDFEIKPIVGIESARPVFRRPQLKFWEWLGEYYLCKLGKIYKAVLPSGFKKESAQNYSEKTDTYITLNPAYTGNQTLLNEVFTSLKKYPKQEKLFLSFLDATHALTEKKQYEITKKELLEKCPVSSSVLTNLLSKGILREEVKAVSRLARYQDKIALANELNPAQQEAYRQILNSFEQKNVCLLHGLTSSGKTEIYIHLIRETLKTGKQALFLLPEIALTSQITHRLKKFFGDKLGVYHSKINNNEKVEIWNNLLNKEGYEIILGVRSSIFLPFDNLGLVIVDEEHESSYKQQDPAPRYHARNAAIVLAGMHGAKVLLGSATPSVESYYNAQSGKYAYVPLNYRFNQTPLPDILPVNIKELKRKKRMKGIFSPLLVEKMKKTLENKEQIILFQNRRGFAPMIYCKMCDWVPKCKYCDVSLTYHKGIQRLVCHYCGMTFPIPGKCPDCGNESLTDKGFGTEKVEEELKAIFPDITVIRMDTDTTRKKDAFDTIISNFENGKFDVLVGTQMISKGLDFKNVSLAAILNADMLMNFPDFRAHERAFQLMSQLAGRAGRHTEKGEVVLQTYNPEHPLIESVLKNDYKAMYNLQIKERYLFHYPPFYRIIEIRLKHKKEDTVVKAAQIYADFMRQQAGDRVLGPDKPIIGKIQNYFIRKIILKAEVSASLSFIRNVIEKSEDRIFSYEEFRYVILQYDVDPM